MKPTKNPCLDVCKFSDGVCIACGRTREEKKMWKRLSDEEKIAINLRLAAEGYPHGKKKDKKAKKGEKDKKKS